MPSKGNTNRAGFVIVAMCAAVVSGWLVAAPAAGLKSAAAVAPTIDSGCSDKTIARFSPVVSWHVARYPDLQVEDLYKLVHQSVAGPAHAIEDPDVARQWLDREWNGLGVPLEDEELYEPLSSDGRLVRVNLRPWRAAGRAPESVLNAFVRTAGTLPPDTAEIRTELDAIAGCADRIAADLGLSAGVIHNFFSDRAQEGYPAIHHSEIYERAHRPAYRVVIRNYLD